MIARPLRCRCLLGVSATTLALAGAAHAQGVASNPFARIANPTAQAAARAAAAAAQAHLPNGLGTGGLQVDPGVAGNPALWLNATAPTPATGGDGRTKVTVDQTQAPRSIRSPRCPRATSI